jgi:hypothetical protein
MCIYTHMVSTHGCPNRRFRTGRVVEKSQKNHNEIVDFKAYDSGLCSYSHGYDFVMINRRFLVTHTLQSTTHTHFSHISP